MENRGPHAGKVRLAVLGGVSSDEVQPFVRGAIDAREATVRTDGLPSYRGLREAGVRHRARVQGDPRHAAKLLPWVHTVASNLKTWLRGTFHGVSPKHLPCYLDEFSYRFDHRWREGELFAFVLRRVARGAPLPYHQLVAEGTA